MKARGFVGVAEFDVSKQAEFGFIEDQDIDEVEQFSAECDSPAPG